MKGEKLLIRHAAKTKDDFSLGTIEGRNRQFIIEKSIHSMEFKDHYQNLTKKARKRRVYQPLFSDITETFFEYTFSQSWWDGDLKVTWKWPESKQLGCAICYWNSTCASFTDYISVVLLYQWETSFYKWINYCTWWRIIEYIMFKNTKSHGVVSLHFLCSLGIFFGLWPLIPKYTLTESYQNLSYETLRGRRNHEIESVSKLTGELSFFIKQSVLANIKRNEEKRWKKYTRNWKYM